jgi:hypothetical protein
MSSGTRHRVIGRIGAKVSEKFLDAILRTNPEDGGNKPIENVTTYPPNYMSRKTVICHIFRIYLAVQCERKARFLQK